MRKGLTLGRVAGIPIVMDFSMVVFMVLVVWLVRGGLLTVGAGPAEITNAAAWAAAVVGALLFLGSVVVHELSHSLTALRLGLAVKQIRLLIFGGLSEIEREADTPRAEMLITIAGPASSAVLAVGFFFTAPLLGFAPAFASLFRWLGIVNGVLAVFNLLPGFPLDGGRALRAFLWARTGNRVRATRVATTIGRGLGLSMAFLGIFLIDRLGLDGLWLAFIGWFLYSAAGVAARSAHIDPRWRGTKVGDVMERTAAWVSPALPLDQVRFGSSDVLPVADPWGSVVGVVNKGAVMGVRADQTSYRTVNDVMRRQSPRYVADVDDLVADVVQRFQEASWIAVVTRNRDPVGVVRSERLRVPEEDGEDLARPAPDLDVRPLRGGTVSNVDDDDSGPGVSGGVDETGRWIDLSRGPDHEEDVGGEAGGGRPLPGPLGE